MTPRPVRFHPEARQEFETSRRWYEERLPGLGEEFVEEIAHSLDLIRETPGRWPRFSAGTRRFVTPRFPFGIIFTVQPGQVVVLAIAHLHRRPGYWQARR